MGLTRCLSRLRPTRDTSSCWASPHCLRASRIPQRKWSERRPNGHPGCPPQWTKVAQDILNAPNLLFSHALSNDSIRGLAQLPRKAGPRMGPGLPCCSTEGPGVGLKKGKKQLPRWKLVRRKKPPLKALLESPPGPLLWKGRKDSR